MDNVYRPEILYEPRSDLHARYNKHRINIAHIELLLLFMLDWNTFFFSVYKMRATISQLKREGDVYCSRLPFVMFVVLVILTNL